MPVSIDPFFDEATNTFSYVIADPVSGDAAILDSVLDYDPASGRTSHGSADRLIAAIKDKGLTLRYILETHVHADHLTAAPYLKAALGGEICIGSKVPVVQDTFAGIYNLGEDFARNGSQFDRLLNDGECLRLGDVEIETLHTPGHTPACVSYKVEDAVFVGDVMFMPDFGSARCDFPGGDARTLYRSVQRILSLPPETRLFMCHDYCPGGRELRWITTVAEQRADNPHIKDGVDEEAFVTLRTERDAKLSMPALLLPSVQVNIRGGSFPQAESNGNSYLKIPLNVV